MQLKLDLSENIIGLDKNNLNKMSQLCSQINNYPRKEEEEKARDTISKYAGVKKENLVLTNGSFHGLEVVFFLFDTKDEIITPIPTFPFYLKYEHYKKFKLKKIKLNNKGQITKEKIIAGLTPKTKCVYLANPQNPTGTLFDKKEMISLLDYLNKKNIYLVSDEAYYEFSNITMADQIKKYKNLIVLRSFSKSFGLAGAKMGYIISNPKTAETLRAIRGELFNVSNLPVLFAAHCASNHSYMKDCVQEINSQKELLKKFFEKNKIEYFNTHANFITFRVNNAEKVTSQLAEKNILVKNLNLYPDGQPLLKNCIRMSIPPKKYLKTVLNALTDVLANSF